MLLNDSQILELCKRGMITPFDDSQIRKNGHTKIVSYGLSSCGYDIRLGREFKELLTNYDQRNPHMHIYNEFETDRLVLDPGQTVLGCSVEVFQMPANVCGHPVGKSTWSRGGIFVNCTLLEPAWEGVLSFAITNLGNTSAVLYAGDGITQILFYEIQTPMITYADRGGKYQGTTTATGGIV